MSERKTPFVIGEYYHLYNRGVEKRTIFMDTKDYQHFLFLMYVCNTEKSITLRDIKKNFERGEAIVDIGAYCLMPNHFHLLVKEKVEGGVSIYMRKVMTAYSMYFNKKYERTGTLFEGTFKSSHSATDRYLKYLYSYIHLNPAKLINKNWKEARGGTRAELLKFVLSYKYSSLSEYMGVAHIINARAFPSYFTKPQDHKAELFSWLNTEENPM